MLIVGRVLRVTSKTNQEGLILDDSVTSTPLFETLVCAERETTSEIQIPSKGNRSYPDQRQHIIHPIACAPLTHVYVPCSSLPAKYKHK
jgi:hypothetical protein